MVIPVVKAAFVPLSATGEKPAIARATRLCGVSPCPVPDTATALPNQARYQLRYTRIFNFCHDTTAERKNKDFLSVVILHFSHPTMPRGKKQQEAGDFLPAFCCFLYRSLTVSPAGPAAALHLLGTDLRRWTAGTCRPSAAQGFARWKAPARCPPCGGRYLLAQSVPSARQGRCSVLRGIRS